MKPKFLFTFGGDLGNQVISEPEGWATIIFNLERDLTYWSLIENFELPLIFYGIAEGNDGGYDYLSAAINNGIDTIVTIDIRVSFDEGITYDICFDGRIDLSTAEETIYRSKIKVAIVRNDLWAQFMANKSKPIDLFSNTDLYGNHRYPILHRELNLVSQKLFESFYGIYQDAGAAYQYSFLSDAVDYGLIDFDSVTISEIETKFDLPVGTASTPTNSDLYELKFAGDYIFNIQVYGQVTVGVDILGNFFNVKLVAGINTINLTKTNSVISFVGGGTANITTYTYSGTLTLAAGDFIQLYFSAITPGTRRNALIYGTTPIPSGAGTPITPGTPGNPLTFMRITANTTYPNTSSDTVLVHDAGLSICDRILGRDDTFYSQFFGGPKTSISYGSSGCGYLNALTRGLNIRGYSFIDKPFTLSFDDWWAGVNPMFNLGLGYEQLGVNSPESTVIRVEQKSYFFDDTSRSVDLTGINDITTQFDIGIFTKTIKIGCEIWNAETISGIDDPQTSHIYNLRYQLFGKDETQLSKFIAASLAIEQTRRLTIVQSQDWRLDENIFIIALQSQSDQGSSPSFINEQPELFGSGITGLSNSSTRYNVRHTPARMLERWSDFYSGQMQSYLTDSFKFGSGEGNILMSWVGDGSCDSGTLTENQNIPISSTYLFLPIVYSFTHPLSWNDYITIRNNRKKAIGISWILGGITFGKIAFIKKLSYDINKSKGTFDVWIKPIIIQFSPIYCDGCPSWNVTPMPNWSLIAADRSSFLPIGTGSNPTWNFTSGPFGSQYMCVQRGDPLAYQGWPATSYDIAIKADGTAIFGSLPTPQFRIKMWGSNDGIIFTSLGVIGDMTADGFLHILTATIVTIISYQYFAFTWEIDPIMYPGSWHGSFSYVFSDGIKITNLITV